MTMTLIKEQSQTKTVRFFQSHSKSSKLEAIPRKVTAHLQPVLFNRAIQLWVCNSVNITCTAIRISSSA